MNVLCIGNSFSANSSKYLNTICPDITVVNLYIGGCSLERHFRNMHSGNRAYVLQVNGVNTGFFVSLDEGLLNRPWDYISFQQASHFSPKYETFEPYLSELSDYARVLCPKAKQVIHETWAYEDGSERLKTLMGYKTHLEMYADIRTAYRRAQSEIEAELMIPSGELFSRLVEKGLKVHLDTYHANKLGEYALGLMWYKTLTGKPASEVEFTVTDEETTALIKETVDSI